MGTAGVSGGCGPQVPTRSAHLLVKAELDVTEDVQHDRLDRGVRALVGRAVPGADRRQLGDRPSDGAEVSGAGSGGRDRAWWAAGDDAGGLAGAGWAVVPGGG